MSWIDDVPASQMAEWTDAGRIGAARYQGPETGPLLTPCRDEPHPAHWMEYGSCPGVKEVDA